MRKWFSDLLEFGGAVLHHWGQLMTGGAIIALVTFYRDSLGNTVTTAFNLGLAVLFFGMAAFGAWREKKGVAGRAIADLQAHVARQKTARDIQEFGKSYIPLYEEGKILKHQTDEEKPVLAPLFNKVSDWQERVTARLKVEIQPGMFIEFSEIKNTEGELSNLYNRRAYYCSMIPEQLRFLHRIIQSPETFMMPF